MQRFNPPPGWPTPPPGWLPPLGWQPDPAWPPAPPGWPLVVDDSAVAPPSPALTPSGAPFGYAAPAPRPPAPYPPQFHPAAAGYPGMGGPPSGAASPGGYVAAVGSGLIALGSFLPWFRYGFFDDTMGVSQRLTAIKGLSALLGMVCLVLGLVSVQRRIGPAVAGLVLVLLLGCLYGLFALGAAASEYDLSIGSGLLLCGIGAVTGFVGFVVSLQRRR